MPDAARKTEKHGKQPQGDPSLDSERESDHSHGRRLEREAKRGEEPRDPRESD